eukprot:Skav202723  [mRNA]  locus=scaffold1326:38339:47352:- [translate_table: standard]
MCAAPGSQLQIFWRPRFCHGKGLQGLGLKAQVAMRCPPPGGSSDLGWQMATSSRDLAALPITADSAALVAGQQRFESARQQWLSECGPAEGKEPGKEPGKERRNRALLDLSCEKTSAIGLLDRTSQRPVLLGALAESAEDAALAAFDQVAQQTPGGNARRTVRYGNLRAVVDKSKDVLYIFQLQRVIAERQALDELNRKLVKKMTERGVMADQAYKASVRKLQPSWASDIKDPAEEATERHLGELQFTIEARQRSFRTALKALVRFVYARCGAQLHPPAASVAARHLVASDEEGLRRAVQDSDGQR